MKSLILTLTILNAICLLSKREDIKDMGITILLVEQNAKKALSIANRAYVLETGSIVLSGDAKELMNDDSVKKAYLSE